MPPKEKETKEKDIPWGSSSRESFGNAWEKKKGLIDLLTAGDRSAEVAPFDFTVGELSIAFQIPADALKVLQSTGKGLIIYPRRDGWRVAIDKASRPVIREVVDYMDLAGQTKWGRLSGMEEDEKKGIFPEGMDEATIVHNAWKLWREFPDWLQQILRAKGRDPDDVFSARER